MLKFTKDHEWVRIDGGTATVGITKHAAGELGDLVFVELPQAGTVLEAGGVAATVESVKAASEVYAPLAGEVTEVNTELTENPGLVNEDPQGKGWLFKLRLKDTAAAKDLMDEAAYQALIS